MFGSSRRAACFCLALMLAAIAAAGCGPGVRATEPRQVEAVRPDDPARLAHAVSCPDRLHDLSGLLLRHFMVHGLLPERLDLVVEDEELLYCPVSGLFYAYDPAGIPFGPGLLVVRDAVPAHAGHGWGIIFEVTGPGQPVTTRVLAVPAQLTGH
jgi:hypothetical protein